MEIHIKGLKMCKRTKHKYHSTQAQRREAHNQAKQGHNKRRIRLNQNQTASSLLGTHMDPLKRTKGVDQPKMGSKVSSGGVATPLVAPFRPKLNGSIHTISPRVVQARKAANSMLRAVCTFHLKGSKEYSKEYTLPLHL